MAQPGRGRNDSFQALGHLFMFAEIQLYCQC
jgi:hypothetical protein